MHRPLALALLVLATSAHAGEVPQERITLSASATVDVTRDLLGVNLATTREGTDAGAVQAGLKQALDAALTEARKVAKPGQVDVQTGAFSLNPRYDAKTGRMNGWQGTAELQVEGRDAATIAQLTSRITTLAISRVAYSLSREAREKAEGEVTAQAIARYRGKAADYARQFGYGGFVVGEVSVGGDEAPPAPMLMKAARMAEMAEPLPTAAGRAAVTVTVSGSVQLTRDGIGR